MTHWVNRHKCLRVEKSPMLKLNQEHTVVLEEAAAGEQKKFQVGVARKNSHLITQKCICYSTPSFTPPPKNCHPTPKTFPPSLKKISSHLQKFLATQLQNILPYYSQKELPPHPIFFLPLPPTSFLLHHISMSLVQLQHLWVTFLHLNICTWKSSETIHHKLPCIKKLDTLMILAGVSSSLL